MNKSSTTVLSGDREPAGLNVIASLVTTIASKWLLCKKNARTLLFEPRCEKTGLRGVRPGQTLARLYSHRRWLEA